MVKGIKKIIGALILFLFGLGCISAVICFVLTLIGKLPAASVGQYWFSLMIYIVFGVISGVLTYTGWCLWKDRPLRTRFRKSDNHKEIKMSCTVEDPEVETQLEKEMQENLKGFFVEDKAPFAAFPIEGLCYDELKNGTAIDKFYLLQNGADVVKSVQKYQECLEKRKQYKDYVNSVPEKVHIRVSSDEDLAGCDAEFYRACGKEGIHLVMHTGPYTLRDFTNNKDYTVVVKTTTGADKSVKMIGTWILK